MTSADEDSPSAGVRGTQSSSGIQSGRFLNQPINVLVYRDSESRHSSREILAELEAALLACIAAPRGEEACLDLLLRAGEVECALADVGVVGGSPTPVETGIAPPPAQAAAKITDAAAAALVGASAALSTSASAALGTGASAALSTGASTALGTGASTALGTGDASHLSDALRACDQLRLPEWLSIKPAEGFAFYAVHPRLYARLVAELPLARRVAVVGIRSIGTTLSAVVAAAARQLGYHAERITVRPRGHPYDREVAFDESQRRCITAQIANDADFLVVDEGPGRSGSSLLATAEALAVCGVGRERITLLCSHGCDPQALLARDAAARWSQFRVLCPETAWLPTPADAAIDISGGKWREHLPAPVPSAAEAPVPSAAEAPVPSAAEAASAPLPASWTATERLKFLSRDGRTLFKFEGYGRFGRTALDRAEALWRAGFGPRVENAGQGFLAYEVVPGAAASAASRSPEIAQRLAAYCAFRAREFPCDDANSVALREMTQCNLREEFAIEPPELQLEIARPAICDARLQPHECIFTPAGELLKCDAASHGDDHFYPGPCDIAWDIAGCIMEWRMDAAAAGAFIAEYARQSGDHVGLRLDDYLLAYTAFRMGWMKMAAESCRGSHDEPRLLAEYRRYREWAEQYVSSSVHQYISSSVRQFVSAPAKVRAI